jgi:hypothetical protein
MSYILDALKKVEHEKLKKSAPGAMTSIAGDLFQERLQQPAGGGRWKIIILIAIVSFITFAGTWFMLRDNKPKSTSLSSSAVQPTPPVAPVPSIPVPAPAPAPAQPATVPAVNVITPAVSPAPPSKADADDEVRSTRAVSRPPKQIVTAVTPQQLKPPLQSVTPPADIKLSGIAWQDERSARRAVVNGFLLKEGSVVSGAKVTEILADRVRFALPTGSFEIRLDAAPATEVKR